MIPFKKRYYAVVLTAIISIMIVIALVARFAGTFLYLNQQPIRSDAIIVLSGGAERVAKGVRLYREGYSRYIILSNAFDTKPVKPIDQIKQYNIPKKSVILETKAQSTYENALFTEKLVKEHHFTSVIVVSSNYHMRRVAFNFGKVYSGTGIRLTYCASNDPRFHPHRWWANSFSLITTLDEYIKLAGNALGINGLAAKKVLNQINHFLL
ncbi:YdcF family protein [Fodinisporobacter ferrooxydans]|uniref:YdcF family protein n=1 Tax=Fodinisporobacter ferrooxydans TaxID=2901836 RepID=A0ABY4CEZ4_9BACL|nr:YdcF family protein [Alicyclobacillaceae bacterium MYW30-H2]